MCVCEWSERKDRAPAGVKEKLPLEKKRRPGPSPPPPKGSGGGGGGGGGVSGAPPAIHPLDSVFTLLQKKLRCALFKTTVCH